MAGLADLRDSLRRVVLHRMQTDPAHDLAHLDRVWKNAQAICDVKLDMQVLLAACYLHDLVNLPKDDPDRGQASRRSAEESEPILSELGFDAAQIRATQHAIAAHSFSAKIQPKTNEARILRDADRLDALGAIGIARTFIVSGALGRALYDPLDPFAETRRLDDLTFSLDHWKVKLLQLPQDMLTVSGQRLAEDRVKKMVVFLQELAEEVGLPLPTSWTNPNN
ncbi:HD domain-containing protein [Ruegeria arenilitoris]|uniref:HD domain-containing protein n=1 Tax=Ruegeria arenilitoris TaxID=1173585 RepID=UPI0014798C85